ncbi:MAG: DUF4139 domain-containing protein [Gemmatimonadota bacterium]|nr:DUF4139 domain-containing protein [Gemmatimonadota bacterium]
MRNILPGRRAAVAAPRTAVLLTAMLLTAAGALPAPASAQDAPPFRSTAADRRGVSLTVYNQNFGLVREVRDLALARGRVALEFGDVASTIQSETVHVRALDGPALEVLEQNYQYDLLSPQKLLEKYVGRSVKLYRWNEAAGRDEVVDAEVLSVNNGTVLRIGDEITFNYPGRIAFPEVPDDLIARPTLIWLLDSRAERQRVETSYLANGLNWKADYVMVLEENDAEAGVTGWVTLTNQSGATWEDAELKLVAGDVQRVQPDRRGQIQMEAMAVRAAGDGFAEEAFFEYHLYTLGRRTTVRNNEQKQVTLLEAPRFAVEKRLEFAGSPRWFRGTYGPVQSNAKVGVFLEFENAEANGLGMPLPAGIVRVYKRDRSGAQQFIGEDRIDHTPRDERLRIRMGEAFDVVGDRRQMEYDVLGNCASESGWKIELRNHKDEDVEVEVVEPVGGDWSIITESHAHEKVDANTFRYRVKVPARGDATITYRVRVRWC